MKKRRWKASVGKVRFERERCLVRSVEQAFFPLDWRLKLKAHQQTTLRLQRLTREIGVRLPHRQVAAVLQELRGVPMTGKQVARSTYQHGQRAVAARRAEVETAWKASSPLGLSGSGACIRPISLKPSASWMGCTCGVVAELGPDLEAVKTCSGELTAQTRPGHFQFRLSQRNDALPV